jgi:hypothetical protein
MGDRISNARRSITSHLAVTGNWQRLETDSCELDIFGVRPPVQTGHCFCFSMAATISIVLEGHLELPEIEMGRFSEWRLKSIFIPGSVQTLG